jgi:hypothetical protein
MSLDGLDGPRLDEKDCWLRHWGSGSPRDSVGRFGSSVCFGSVGLESAEPAKSAKSAAGANYESGRFMVQGLTERTVGPDKGAAAAMPIGGKISTADLCSCRFVGENRQRRFFDEHGLDAGLARPCRKIHRGDTLMKQHWFRHGGQCWNWQSRRNQQSRQNRQQVLAMSLDGLDSPRLDEKDCRFRHWGSGSPRDSVGKFDSSVCFGSVGLDDLAARDVSFKSLPCRLQLLTGGD